MKKRILLFAFLLTACYCHAQKEDLCIVPDRPGYTWGPETAQLHKLVWENGIGFERHADGQQLITLNSTILRYGMFENFEVMVGTDFLLYEAEGQVTKSMGITPLSIGAKYRCYEGSGLIPSIGLAAQLQSPHIGSADFLPSYMAPSMYLIAEHAFDRFYVCYNIGAEWDGETAIPTKFLALNVGFSITEEITTYLESYNYLHPDGNQYKAEFGFAILPNRKIQLDVEVDFDLQQLGKYFAIGGGISWMIN